jgi:hypothetical protein
MPIGGFPSESGSQSDEGEEMPPAKTFVGWKAFTKFDPDLLTKSEI